MIPIVQHVIAHYSKLKEIPSLENINGIDEALLNNQGCVFVTLYKKGEICGSAGNIKEIKANLAEELVENTISALKDTRFPDIDVNEAGDIKIRIDTITERSILAEGAMQHIDPVTHGILVLKKDYAHMAAILPNIDPKILTGSDYSSLLAKKLGIKTFQEKDYIIYKISTQQDTNF